MHLRDVVSSGEYDMLDFQPETTVTHIVNYYDYPRRPLAPLYDEEQYSEETQHPLYAANHFLDSHMDGDPFGRPTRNTVDDPVFLGADVPRNDGGSSLAAPPLERVHSLPIRMRSPPIAPPPAPPVSREEAGEFDHPSSTDVPSTERTYGQTAQILQLTPSNAVYPPYVGPSDGSTTMYPHFDSENGYYHPANPPRRVGVRSLESAYDDNVEEQENVPPMPSSPAFRLPFETTLMRRVERSSSVYPDDDDAWESVQDSESRANFADVDFAAALEEQRPSQESYANTSNDNSPNRPKARPTSNTFMPFSKKFFDMLPGRGADNKLDERADMPSQKKAYAALPDWREVAQTDKKKGKAILEDKIMQDVIGGQLTATSPKLDKTQHAADLKALKELRSQTATHRRPFDVVADKLNKFVNISPLKPVYSPSRTLLRTPQVERPRHANPSIASDTMGLLDSTPSPYRSGGLQFSDTLNTFQTTPSPRLRVKPYSPLTPNPITSPLDAVVRDRHTPRGRPQLIGAHSSPLHDDEREEIELQPLQRSKGKQGPTRAAMSSQTALHPLTLADPTYTRAAATTRLTDEQLLESAPGWTVEPNPSSTGAVAHFFSREMGFGIQQEDGTVERVRLLMGPREGRNLREGRLQRELTRPYFVACSLCPVSAVFFGLGGLDWWMRRASEGKVEEMAPVAKKDALCLAAPLGAIFYAIVVIVVFMAVRK
ncbi:hypothetical protein BDY17DRAFT_152707 [Neohortaea acidophila]|uniref:Uncharacterized protein n=1 Tax=Neohortaea acidophila TaxID=245834 RepID=A0A6A6PUD6_9PEZI|nr:uncharacterized protein BDY17DRAFT_152707 [Neohortaea acidophila]KAF2483700.1 hypothetical protein BDY17DRAFT_152707 [Neohortaea acidophila]